MWELRASPIPPPIHRSASSAFALLSAMAKATKASFTLSPIMCSEGFGGRFSKGARQQETVPGYIGSSSATSWGFVAPAAAPSDFGPRTPPLVPFSAVLAMISFFFLFLVSQNIACSAAPPPPPPSPYYVSVCKVADQQVYAVPTARPR